MEWYYILLICLGSILVLGFLIFIICGSVFYHISFHRRKGDKDFAKNESEEKKNTPDRLWLKEQKIEEYTLKSFDNKKLKGYMIRNKDSNKLAFLVHGYRGRYYSGAIQAEAFYKAGYSVFAVNHRAHDSSEGTYFSMGPKEEKDIISWLQLLIKENPNYEIIIAGVSMGAHITMKVVGNKDLPSNVKCALADCGYASLEDELKLQLATYKIPKLISKFIYACGKGFAKLFHKQTFHSDTKESLANCHIPVLFIHSDIDTYVPYENLEINYNNLCTGVYKEKITYEGATHSNSYRVHHDKYCQDMLKFAERFIK